MAEIIEATDTTYNMIEENEIFSIILFTSEGCGHCKALLSLLKVNAGIWETKAKLFVVDLAEGPETAARFGVMALPTLIILRKGEIINEFRGMPGQTILMNTLRDL